MVQINFLLKLYIVCRQRYLMKNTLSFTWHMRVVNLWQSSQYYCKITDVSHIFTLVHSNCVNVNALCQIQCQKYWANKHPIRWTIYLDNKQRSDLAFTSFFGQFCLFMMCYTWQRFGAATLWCENLGWNGGVWLAFRNKKNWSVLFSRHLLCFEQHLLKNYLVT